MVRPMIVVAASLVLLWAGAIAVFVAVGRRSDARALAASIPDMIRLLRGLVTDPRVSRGSKVLLWIALVWCLSPIDLIPEFIPLLGPLDDIVVVMLVLRTVLRRTDPGVIAEHWRGDPRFLRPFVGSAAEVPGER